MEHDLEWPNADKVDRAFLGVAGVSVLNSEARIRALRLDEGRVTSTAKGDSSDAQTGQRQRAYAGAAVTRGPAARINVPILVFMSALATWAPFPQRLASVGGNNFGLAIILPAGTSVGRGSSVAIRSPDASSW